MEKNYVNNYVCPECGHKWADLYSSMCNMDCPECGISEVQPAYSIDLDELNNRPEPKWSMLMKIFSDVEWKVFVFDENRMETQPVREKFIEVLTSVGCRQPLPGESVKDYWIYYRDEYQDKLRNDWSPELMTQLKCEDCFPEEYDAEDDYIVVQDVTML